MTDAKPLRLQANFVYSSYSPALWNESELAELTLTRTFVECKKTYGVRGRAVVKRERNPVDVAMGERIASARRLVGIDRQEELAEMLGVDRGAVARWEAGYNRPKVDNLNQLATILKKPLEWLIGGNHAVANEGRKLDRKEIDEIGPALKGMSAGHEVWQLSTDNIAGAGYRAGDYLLVDVNKTPKPRDFVLAKSHDRIVFRQFFPPHLFAVAFGANIPHDTVDGVTTKILGVISGRFSP